uniref:Metalloendopeptidase n=1 Tax=Cyprinus carpio TaxID=7962 RepID=A0A8C2JZ80_CYPCA
NMPYYCLIIVFLYHHYLLINIDNSSATIINSLGELPQPSLIPLFLGEYLSGSMTYNLFRHLKTLGLLFHWLYLMCVYLQKNEIQGDEKVMFLCSIRCYSTVGNRRMEKQNLSIGANCDHLGIVEHEFLHALGFWHEQSRSDRDDYVTIMWEQIKEGHKHNFNLHNETVSSSLGVPYDYGSVMHYSKEDFSKGSKPTIVTKIPEFLDVIGQRMEFSDSDLLKLNRLYNCSKFMIKHSLWNNPPLFFINILTLV